MHFDDKTMYNHVTGHFDQRVVDINIDLLKILLPIV